MLRYRLRSRRFMSLLLSVVLLASLITVPVWDSGFAAAAANALMRAIGSAQVLYCSAGTEVDAAIVDGALEIIYKSMTTAKLKLRIAAEGSSSFNNYDFKPSTRMRIPLKTQASAYTVQICENISGKQYRIAYETVVRVSSGVLPIQQEAVVTAASSSSPYLASIDRINWAQGMECIQKAQELAAGKASNRDKAEAVYNFLVGRMSYDMSKVGKLPSSYKPDLDSTYSTRMGICYDIAALYAGMLRAVGVPTKLIMGYTSMVQGYHAWNQVDLGDGKWHNVDVTTDCQLRGYGESVSFSSPKGTFSTVKEY